jgi:ABC-type oligopeptide transport system substrate-binding subunit
MSMSRKAIFVASLVALGSAIAISGCASGDAEDTKVNADVKKAEPGKLPPGLQRSEGAPGEGAASPGGESASTGL